MQGKIAIEEHFLTAELSANVVPPSNFPSEVWRNLQRRLEDADGKRLEEMDRAGVERSVLSLPYTVQDEPDGRKAAKRAAEGNDALAEIVAAHPYRYSGWAAVALQDPEAASKEAERAVRELGFCGVMVYGYSNVGDGDTGEYYDAEKFWPFWEALEELDVPFYLHPRDPLPSQRRIYEGRPELLGSPWAFGVETATHALRLIVSGLFDRFPGLTVILGHLGETLPFALNRLDHRLQFVPDRKMERSATEYFQDNFYVTTSGSFHTVSLLGILLEFGADRVLFAVDHPFEKFGEQAAWFDQLPIGESDRAKIGRGNAQSLFGF